ncbi:hypothetical protein SSABA_v1c03030 [Spiroplasma sabaudiense Ar-1343]|uniref:Uncharacterized protein n=1 Tax=Spiroplasma sabaudiense Ar-1343 TaxID=1276257 RepID=W6AA58_9MOLU|nr:hypothetical protein [Spiroplasma sabaudiense]AHI53715.1 hypothetical protein SSABA_v1c03030 [Spiroplasma sabaudiense Ar-1343]
MLKSPKTKNWFFNDGLIKQIQFKEVFFNWEKNKPFYKWEISRNGKIEKTWRKTQKKKFKINELNIVEIFNKKFANSKFKNLQHFLKANMNANLSAITLQRVKYFTCCLENIWFQKYLPKFEKININLEEISTDSKLLFYPQYLIFISKLRNSIINNVVELIIPSVVSFGLLESENNFNVKEEMRRAKNFIKVAFSNVKIETAENFKAVNNEIIKLYKQHGNENNNNLSDNFLTEINSKEVFKANFLRYEFIKASRTLKLRTQTNMKKAFQKYQLSLAKAEIKDLIEKNDINTKNLHSAWNIYSTYRNENTN